LLFDAIDRSNVLGRRDYAVYALMYNLGLRVGEVHRLNVKDLDLTGKKITVMGKGQRRRTLPLNKEMVKVLSEWLMVRHRFLNSDKTNALFISKKGNRLAIRTMEDNFQKTLKKADFDIHFHVTCHTLRHSFASHLNDNGTDVLVIQSLLGHSSPKSSEIYIHPSEKRVREALEKLPGVVFMNQLIESGALKLRFQSSYRPRRE
jgi:site-specific recombinase XerD